jgi:hypothetical protein
MNISRQCAYPLQTAAMQRMKETKSDVRTHGRSRTEIREETCSAIARFGTVTC